MGAQADALTIAELALTPILVRELGSGARTTLAWRCTSTRGRHPCSSWAAPPPSERARWAASARGVMSIAVAEQVESGELRVTEVDGLDRVLLAVWQPPRQLEGPAGDGVRLARRAGGRRGASG